MTTGKRETFQALAHAPKPRPERCDFLWDILAVPMVHDLAVRACTIFGAAGCQSVVLTLRLRLISAGK
ncbi:hypothetical protein [Polaromonas sp. CG9_12]|nr:hypothetical protein [Polaromonas sp. CG_9.11]CDS54584.1 hypothetical protein [Polaromonas sp. CG9_12]